MKNKKEEQEADHSIHCEQKPFYIYPPEDVLCIVCTINIFGIEVIYTVRTVAADLRQGEHIPNMQNDIGCKSTICMFRHPRSGWGSVLCRAALGPALSSAQLP